MKNDTTIVLDTAAFIAGTDNLFNSPDQQNVTFYTIQDVIDEVRDKKARQRLELLNGSITIRAPSSEALASVINFAKATGDFAVLSMTDLKVIALCWMLEEERNGGTYFKTPPERDLITEIRCGRLVPFDELDRLEREQRDEEVQLADDGWQTVGRKQIETEKSDDKHIAGNGDASQPGGDEPSKTEKKRRRRRRRKKPLLVEEELNADDHIDPNQNMIVDGQNVSTGDENANENEAEEDDGVGWINMDNLAEHLAREGGEEEETDEDRHRIGCVTTDFAMQNTMLQMGLKVLSVDGRRAIKKIKNFALRCHTCGTITTERDRIFCYRCGNATMHRVAFKVDKKGMARAYLNPKKKPVLRGTKYPIPMPRGGRYNRDLILCEDQIDPVKQRRLQKQRERLNVDVLDPSNFYNAGARFDPNNRPLVVGYGRRNPNEVGRTSHCKR